ncbi:hypothetical protein FCU45_00305 [Sulfurimonas crateris]|uniref:Uncharacterized protein n=1 Tax=Sulfurimonas crateris TaxID=2574727 RepID=A0A4U2Z977_9BACT|nr:hypothetical protein [Sulfurimonas crateris]TKI70868.1 hypothetical protein FCU45_00305 [Sulfurimonas crateris]
MEGTLYLVSLIVVAIMAFALYRGNSFKLMLLVLAVGVYIIYSHETGNSATKYKDEVLESLDKSARDFSKSRGAEGYNEDKIIKKVVKD